MIFWNRVMQKINSLWYPRAVTIGKPVETQELAERLARESTVAPSDVHAVVRAFPEVLAEYLAESRAVHLEGLGWFHLTVQCTGKGVDTREAVSSNQITGVKVQFSAERQRDMSNGGTYTRALVSKNISFAEWFGKVDKDGNAGEGGGTGSGDGDSNENPLG